MSEPRKPFWIELTVQGDTWDEAMTDLWRMAKMLDSRDGFWRRNALVSTRRIRWNATVRQEDILRDAETGDVLVLAGAEASR